MKNERASQPMFRQWANQARVTDDPVGDLIGDFRTDRGAPDDFESLARLRRYLNLKNACPEAIEAAAVAWRRYRSWLKQREKSGKNRDQG